MKVNLEELKKEWQSKFLNSDKFKERKKLFQTDSGIEIDCVYLPNENFDYISKLGFPGEYPYTRGVYPTMYRGRLWTMRQYAGFGTAEETNKRFKYLLEHGQMGLSVAFDLPTQMGYDSDHPMAEGEVGRVGVAIDSLQDMEILFDGIDLEKITTSMTINATAAILLAMYVAVAKKQGANLKKISGTIQNDILKEYIARGTYIYPPVQSMKLIVDIFQWCNENLPKWNVISISGYHIREAGANAVQELAFTFANAIEYVRSAVNAGLDVNKFGAQLSFFFNAHNNFFEEIAKFRAARRIWAKIMREKFGATNEEAMKLKFHAQTAGSTLTAQQIENNIVRVTIQALAAVLGGCQSLHTNAKDEALALPTEESARTALRTQQIIAYESGVTDTVDPLAGSYFVEYLTDEIERRVWEYIETIEAMGGAIRAIESGYIQNEISKSAYEYQMKIETGEKIIVGVNEFKSDEGQRIEIFKLNEEAIKKQIERLKKLRMERDNDKVKLSLKRLKEGALLGENLMPLIIECVEAYATIGEISDALREIWGEYKER
ncbi:methylmalonyl-CoA mutase [Candidatus Kryptobacter tengchongensis]|uniref:Methylmalonyl-CoA mutase n=2 Tax=Kryptobacter tengchongensis TaxID=1643429 RepID=A0A656D3R3_KRYT1|nr:methylmalonyl-CoA mutase family protein [Candidatus Kryptobacter tengchongensis]CUS96524.1 methylmalonyl-CoA mutase [Candidatus Kryptobacter tengchongensis]CUT00045.1 methylmalonyl-CoA mutase [Candidatus Kryptobacter tengchongensis]CUU06944.1 methylmalonyl-CoA mutase [Candidatus Kryptobacter tengchongensis]